MTSYHCLAASDKCEEKGMVLIKLIIRQSDILSRPEAATEDLLVALKPAWLSFLSIVLSDIQDLNVWKGGAENLKFIK